jgi:hypothetical protein
MRCGVEKFPIVAFNSGSERVCGNIPRSHQKEAARCFLVVAIWSDDCAMQQTQFTTAILLLVVGGGAGFLAHVAARSVASDGRFTETTFFAGHDARGELEKSVTDRGGEVLWASNGGAGGGQGMERSIQIEFTGSEAIRTEVLQHYRGVLRGQISAMDPRAHGQKTEGNEAFRLSYQTEERMGFVSVISHLTDHGNVRLSVLMYEHPLLSG